MKSASQTGVILCISSFQMSEQKVERRSREFDPVIPGQEIALMSIIGPHNTNQKTQNFMFKIRGVCSKNDVSSVVKEIDRFDNTFDIFAAPVGHWMPFITEPKYVKDVIYENSQINSIMKNYQETKDEQTQEFASHYKDCKQELAKHKNRKPEENALNHAFNMAELQAELQHRKNQLESMNEDYQLWFTAEQRKVAESKLEESPVQDFLKTQEFTNVQLRRLDFDMLFENQPDADPQDQNDAGIEPHQENDKEVGADAESVPQGDCRNQTSKDLFTAYDSLKKRKGQENQR